MTPEASVKHINEDLPQQNYSPKDTVMLVNGAEDSRQQPVEGALTHSPISSAQSSNDAAGLSTNATSNALPTCWESGGTQTAGVPRCSNAFGLPTLGMHEVDVPFCTQFPHREDHASRHCLPEADDLLVPA